MLILLFSDGPTVEPDPDIPQAEYVQGLRFARHARPREGRIFRASRRGM